ncbi:MAG: transporter associated domain-containing protein [Planctomycetaceae bacterium]
MASVITETIVELDPRLHIDDLNEQFNYNLPEEGDYDTIGEFIHCLLNRVPNQDEILDWNHLKFTILDVDRKINKSRRKDRNHPEAIKNSPSTDR